jgi:hypothetical protein
MTEMRSLRLDQRLKVRMADRAHRARHRRTTTVLEVRGLSRITRVIKINADDNHVAVRKNTSHSFWAARQYRRQLQILLLIVELRLPETKSEKVKTEAASDPPHISPLSANLRGLKEKKPQSQNYALSPTLQLLLCAALFLHYRCTTSTSTIHTTTQQSKSKQKNAKGSHTSSQSRLIPCNFGRHWQLQLLVK